MRYELDFYIPEDDILHSHCRENLKSYIALTGCSYRPRRLWELYTIVRGYFNQGIKRPGREAEPLPPNNLEAKKTWIYTSILP
jgi:hypothetical protein